MARFYDAYGDKERHRHEQPSGRVALAVHCGFLDELVRADDLVLDAGAGPGRFTIDLARRGARVHVGDLSPVPLDLNRLHVDVARHDDAAVTRDVLDVSASPTSTRAPSTPSRASAGRCPMPGTEPTAPSPNRPG